MRFLADMPISQSTVRYLRSGGHDANHLLDLGLECAKDREIVELALKESRIILTMDLDFAAILATSRSNRPSVIIFRLKDNRPVIVNKLLEENLENISFELEKGAIAIFEKTRVRIRKLPT